MARPLFQLGTFQFDLPNGVPQTLDREAEYRWETQSRLLRDPAVQFLGPGSQTITLDGVLYPGFSGRQSTLQTLRDLAAKGQPQTLTDGLGRVYGKWAITTVREGLSTFAPGGGARRIAFTLSLVRYAEDSPGRAASPLAVAPVTQALQNTTGGFAAFLGNGSAFDASSWASSAANSVVATAAKGAGFELGQLAAIARSVANQDYVGAALGAFGLNPLSVQQQGVWGQLGISAAQMVQQMALGRGAPTMSVALQALQPATTAMLSTLGGGAGGGQALADLVRSTATIATMLDVDPFITSAVQQVIRP